MVNMFRTHVTHMRIVRNECYAFALEHLTEAILSYLEK